MSKESWSGIVCIVMVIFLPACGQDPILSSGSEIYSKYCATCHQADGEGIEGAFPPISESEWAEGDEGRLIRLVLVGMQGPLEVKGEAFNNVMTPHGFLTDEQIAHVLTFVRSSFGNDAGPIVADQVMRVRASEDQDELYLASKLFFQIGIPE